MLMTLPILEDNVYVDPPGFEKRYNSNVKIIKPTIN